MKLIMPGAAGRRERRDPKAAGRSNRRRGVSTRLASHALVVALCVGVAYVGRKDPTPRLYPGSPELIALASIDDPAARPGNPLASALVALPRPADAIDAAVPGPAASGASPAFLSALREIPVTMSNIVTGDQDASAGTSPALAPIAYSVAPGDSLWSIAQNFGVSPDSITRANRLDPSAELAIGQKLLVPPIPGDLYVVRDGDTLESISHQFQTREDDIARVNALPDPNALAVGTTLVIPKAAPAAPATTVLVATASATTETTADSSTTSTATAGTTPASAATAGTSSASSAAANSSRSSPSTDSASAAPGPATTYVVQPGDSISSIAVARGVDAAALASANGIAAPYLLQPGQKLTIPAEGNAPKPEAPLKPTAPSNYTIPGTTPKPTAPSDYTIRPGDTLSRIAAIFGLNAAGLAAKNRLTDPSQLQPGQRLVLAVAPTSTTVPPTSTPLPATPTPFPPTPTPPPTPAPVPAPPALAPPAASRILSARPHNPNAGWGIVATAAKYLGFRYVWGGTSPTTGFDCSGFVWYVYGRAGVPIPRELSAQIASGRRVARADLQAGDIVFFDNTYKPGLSHDGIYIGGGRFISAADYGIGVVVSNLDDAYWSSRYDGAARPW